MSLTASTKKINERLSSAWQGVATAYLPFADAANEDLPLSQLIRLSLLQVSIGVAVALICGVLNRVMIVELEVSASLVAIMIALPLFIAPFRTMIGHRSDTHKSALGWKRVPFVWFGTLFQFGGLAIMPFALIILSGDSNGPLWLGPLAAGLAFSMVGLGVHMTQTAGLALATDLVPAEDRGKVVALLHVMLLFGMVAGSIGISALLMDFSQIRLIRVVQGIAVFTIVVNVIALWKQEARASGEQQKTQSSSFAQQWQQILETPGALRFFFTVTFGTLAFSMQDVLLEPFGAEVLQLPVSATSLLTALFALGSLFAFAFAAKSLSRGSDSNRLAAFGLVIGVAAFSFIIFAALLTSTLLFALGTFWIGFGAGLFAVCTLVTAMALVNGTNAGLVIGIWGALQTCGAGIGIAAGGGLRDMFSNSAAAMSFSSGIAEQAAGYLFVYQIEIGLLFLTMILIGPLARYRSGLNQNRIGVLNLAELPG